MKLEKGIIKETFLDGSVRIECPHELIPAPGQYLLAHANASDAPLADPVFFSHSAPNGFVTAPPTPNSWMPGTILNLRGPLGHGFAIPVAARKIALIAFDDYPARLHGLIPLALNQNAEVVLLCDSQVNDLPEVVEVQPVKAMQDILLWADYAAVDVSRGKVNQLREKIMEQGHVRMRPEAQVLIRTQMPCGALAECGVCAVTIGHYWKMACKDGPVFGLNELL
ncbi:MAG: hypothetical protein JNM02_03995 [Anaerolineales bacterium]|nr:hypothetical protein [Anaerolineales bacterium]